MVAGSRYPAGRNGRCLTCHTGSATVSGKPYLPYHVEMRAAAMLISSGVRDAQVVMNNVPCGFRPGTTRGCHQALEHFLPTGTMLTVLGSDSDGRPFHHTYRGRAGS